MSNGRPYMPRTRVLITIFCVAIAGCGKGPTAEVRILPASYEIGSVKSELATPAVDEVVRVKAANVRILACTSTPPAKVMQFRKELLARAQPEISFAFLNEGCGS